MWRWQNWKLVPDTILVIIFWNFSLMFTNYWEAFFLVDTVTLSSEIFPGKQPLCSTETVIQSLYGMASRNGLSFPHHNRSNRIKTSLNKWYNDTLSSNKTKSNRGLIGNTISTNTKKQKLVNKIRFCFLCWTRLYAENTKNSHLSCSFLNVPMDKP